FAEAFAFADSAGSPRTSGGDEVKRLNAGFQSIMDRLAKYTVSWKYLDDIFASMAEGVMVVNRPQGSTALIVVRVNAAMEKMLGAEERKIAGSKVDDWFRSEARIDTSDWRSAGKGTIVRKEETVMVTVGGEDLPVAISVAALSEENSEGTSYVFVVQDIGVRKLADAALRRAAAIVRASSNPIIVLDENGSIVEVNPAFEASTGIAGNAIFGRRPDFFALNENQLNEMLRQSALGVPWRGEVGLVLEGDTRTVMMVSTSATFDEGGEVESYILVMSDITGIKERETRFAELAKTDSLTGIANRKDFLDTLNEAVANARAKERLLAVLYIDLDGFKEINDKLGHAAGDAILVEVTERLRDAVRSTDLLARLGGDEFAVLLPNLRIESGVNSVAANVVESLQKPFDYEGEIVTVHCSVGCAVFPTDARKAEDLLKGADKAMYEAKRSGKNTFRRSDGIRNSG
ncbi:MAG: sensor domain-containing diguanylate cyclase, partial [Gemmatimonadota bacterium]|nr:sensor domain-containing diguanylate cyclase [Gemmatimonadota bacterium]